MGKRIIHIVGDSEFGGGSIIILDLAQSAVENGFEVDILTTDNMLSSEAARLGIGVISIDVIRRQINPLWDTFGMISLFLFLNRNRYDVVHTHTSKAGFVGRFAATLARIPLIIHTVHGFAFHEESSRMELIIYSFFEHIASLACDYLVFVSHFHEEWASNLNIGSRRKRIVIRNGISEDRISATRSRENISRDFGVSINSPWIVTAGRLARQKGLIYLLQAALKLRQLGMDFQIIIVGEGPLRADLTSFVKCNELQDYVLFTGFQKDAGSFVSAADIIALPSSREGLSISLLEAMSASKPIVATAIGSNKEVLEDGASGLIVPSNNSEILAEKLSLLLDDKKLCNRLGTKAYERYKMHYTADRMLREYMQLYKSSKGLIRH